MEKIVQINVVGNWGSTGHIAEEIGKHIISSGRKSYIACGRKIRNSSSHILQVGNTFLINMHIVQTRLLDNHGLCSKNATKKLIQQINQIKPNLIHLHNIHGYYLNYEILFDFISKVNIPIVWTLHDCWSFTGHCAYYTYSKCEKWKMQCYHCPSLSAYPTSYFKDRSKKNYLQKAKAFTSVTKMTLVPVSNWLAKDVSQSFLHKYPIRVINNGIDINVFTPYQSMKSKYGLVDQFVIVGVASLWDQRKGLNDFITLAARLKPKEVILLIGLSAKQLSKLPPNVIGFNRTESQQQLAELYSLADVFLNPTWEDNFPTTNLEALACGTPVITYRTGGSIEAVSDHTGFIVEPGNIEAIINVINIIKEKGKSYYSDACRDRAVKLYNKQERYNDYMQLYKEILNNNNDVSI